MALSPNKRMAYNRWPFIRNMMLKLCFKLPDEMWGPNLETSPWKTPELVPGSSFEEFPLMVMFTMSIAVGSSFSSSVYVYIYIYTRPLPLFAAASMFNWWPINGWFYLYRLTPHPSAAHQQTRAIPKAAQLQPSAASTAGAKRKAALLCSSRETQPETHCIGSTTGLLTHTGCISLGLLRNKPHMPILRNHPSS